ncbi:hypothetical protein BaRGS_00017517 [Batillaria attramentaria]|uniref:Uncharacterized protein n=1 Tax=Batillaria attramentaria TaxID=370345 RepID=A0ABD0KVD8_9CAEN
MWKIHLTNALTALQQVWTPSFSDQYLDDLDILTVILRDPPMYSSSSSALYTDQCDVLLSCISASSTHPGTHCEKASVNEGNFSAKQICTITVNHNLLKCSIEFIRSPCTVSTCGRSLRVSESMFRFTVTTAVYGVCHWIHGVDISRPLTASLQFVLKLGISSSSKTASLVNKSQVNTSSSSKSEYLHTTRCTTIFEYPSTYDSLIISM